MRAGVGRTDTDAWLVRAYLAIAVCAVAALAVLTPPIEVPDEHQHFYRAYQVSEGHLLSRIEGEQQGDDLPASVVALGRFFFGGDGLHGGGPRPHLGLRERLQMLRLPLRPEERVFADFSGSASYWPVAYLPQAAAIAAGRLAGLGPLGLFYAARLLNGLSGVLLTAAALRLMPTGRTSLLIFALLPMTLYQMASCSADAVTIGAALVFTALCARSWAGQPFSFGAGMAALVAGSTVCATKPFYLPLALLAAVPARPGASRLPSVAVPAGIVLITLGWRSIAPVFLHSPLPDVDAAAQLRFIEAHLGQFLVTLAFTVRHGALTWLEQGVGILGWLSVRLPGPMLALPACMLAAAAAMRAPAPWPGPLVTLWFAALGGASVLVTLTVLFLVWTPVGGTPVQGMQGRYLLPLAGLAALVLEGRLPLLDSGRVGRLVVALGAVEALLTLAIVVRAFPPA